MRKAHIKRARTVEDVRQSLVELRRLFQRRELAELWEAAFGRSTRLDYTELRLLDAISVSAHEEDAGGATVGDVSRALGVDPSRASRQVASAVEKGLLERRVAPGDGRKVVLSVTARGSRLQAKGSELTRARIALALGSWSDADVSRFSELFGRFVAAMLSAGEEAAR